MCCSQVINKVLLDNEKKIGWKINFFNVGLPILKVLKDNKLTVIHNLESNVKPILHSDDVQPLAEN